MLDSCSPGQKCKEAVSRGIRAVVLLIFDEPGDCCFSFLCFSVICLLSSTGVLKAGTCMPRVYTSPEKCQPGLMTISQTPYCCITILQISLQAQITLIRATPGVEGGGWGRRESTVAKPCTPLADQGKHMENSIGGGTIHRISDPQPSCCFRLGWPRPVTEHNWW